MIRKFLVVAGAYAMGGFMVGLYFQPKITKLENEVYVTRESLRRIDSSMNSNMSFRKQSLEDRRIMKLQLDTVLANQEEQKIWHYQGLARTVQRDSKIDSINAALKKRGKQ